MTRSSWVETSLSEVRGTPHDLSLSYLSPDARLAILTDYTEHRTRVLRGEPLGLDPARFPNQPWLAPAARGLRRCPPDEDVRGYGIFTFPYGPVTGGVPEAVRFDVRTYGERILELTPVTGFKRRGVLAGIAGLPLPDAALRVERMVGNLSAAHVTAFLTAAESARGLPVPERELWTRALALELQRIYNHLHAVARVAESAAQSVGQAQVHALSEEVLRLAGWAFGHRWLFGALLPGGPDRRLEPSDRRTIGTRIARISADFQTLWDLLSHTRIFVDRIQGTSPIPRREAIRWGAVGPTLRASSVGWDDRVHAPIPPYTDLFVAVPQGIDGDALDRIAVRVGEIQSSTLAIEQILDRWPAASGEIPPEPCVEAHRGIARVEGPNGDLIYDVTMQGDRVAGASCRSASEANLPLLALGSRQSVFTDFSFAWESFGFVIAEVDR